MIEPMLSTNVYCLLFFWQIDTHFLIAEIAVCIWSASNVSIAGMNSKMANPRLWYRDVCDLQLYVC